MVGGVAVAVGADTVVADTVVAGGVAAVVAGAVVAAAVVALVAEEHQRQQVAVGTLDGGIAVEQTVAGTVVVAEQHQGEQVVVAAVVTAVAGKLVQQEQLTEVVVVGSTGTVVAEEHQGEEIISEAAMAVVVTIVVAEGFQEEERAQLVTRQNSLLCLNNVLERSSK